MHDYTAISERYQLEASHAWFKARQRLIVWAIRKYSPHISNFLEIGVGTGVMLSAIAEAFSNVALYGADRGLDNLSFVSKHLPNCKMIQLNTYALPFNEEFDLIAEFDVLEHIEDDLHALREVHRSLKPGGGLILTVPQHPFLWSRYDEYDGGWGGHKRRYTRKELIHKVTVAGFNLVKATSFISLPLPALITTRLLPSKHEITALTGLKPHPILNHCMEKILRLEYGMICKGIDFPFGGSLLLVAKKSTP